MKYFIILLLPFFPAPSLLRICPWASFNSILISEILKITVQPFMTRLNNPILLKGSGYNIWFERDEFHYLFNKIKGDFILTANFKFEGNGTEPHRKTGWMLRTSTEDNSPHISAVLHGDGLTVMQWRDNEGALMKDPEDQVFARGSHYEIIQVERSGSIIFMRASHPGEPFEDIGSYEMINLPDEILAGLVCLFA